MSIDTDMDAELRRLFDNLDGDRLDIPVRPGAERMILAGAQRVRRRRHLAAAAGVVVAIVLVGGGIAVGGGMSNTLPPAENTVTETVTQAAPSSIAPAKPSQRKKPPAARTKQPPAGQGQPENDPPPPAPPEPPPALTDGVLTAGGYGPFQLGMSTDDALATGLLRLFEHGGNCVRYKINGGGKLVISGQLGMTSIGVPDRVRTPEGLGTGSTVGEVRAAYPWAQDSGPGLTAGTTGEGSAAYYEFRTAEAPPAEGPVPDEFVVAGLRLRASTNDCAGF